MTVLFLSGKTNDEPRIKSSTVDGIEITATASKESDGKTLIQCVLTNRSKFILASCFPRTSSKCFRFKLLGKNGIVLPLEEDWALSFAQPTKLNSSRLDSRSWSDIYIRHDETCKFYFVLEDAYGDKAKDGKVLEVQWFNIDPLPRGNSTLSFEKTISNDGKVFPAHKEENHFPRGRVFTVKLPLSDDALIEEDKPSVIVPSQDIASPDKKPASDASKQNDKQKAGSDPLDLRWLFLLLVPALFIAWRIVCARKAS